MAGILTRDMAFAVADPALTALWVVRVPFAYSLIEIVAEQMTATIPKVPATARFNQGSNSYYPGTKDIDAISITFYETVDHKVSQWLKGWRALINHDDGTYGLPTEYKKPILLEFYSNASQRPIKKITYVNCWPTDQGAYELNYNDETGRITVQAQFSVDSQQD